MAKHNVDCSTWLITMVVLALILTNPPAANAEVNCKDCVIKLIPCKGFLTGEDPTISVACCSGAQELDQIAIGSEVDKRAICECLKEAAKSLPINFDRANQLAPLCHLKTKLEIRPDIDCNKI